MSTLALTLVKYIIKARQIPMSTLALTLVKYIIKARTDSNVNTGSNIGKVYHQGKDRFQCQHWL